MTSSPRPRARALLRAALLGAVIFAAVRFSGRFVPQTQHVELLLGSDAARVRELRVRYARGDEAEREATLRFPSGAPRLVSHEPELTDGSHLLSIELLGEGARAAWERPVMLSGDHTERLDLTAEASSLPAR